MRSYILVFVLLLMNAAVSWAEDTSEFSRWNFKISGEERFRYEYKKDFDLNKSLKDNGSQLFHRFRLSGAATLTDEYLKPKLDIFMEGLDAQTGGYRLKAVSNQTDDFDLHQAFINVHNVAGSDFDFKAGRQELKYGKGRLIGAPAWGNRMRSFDAALLHYQHDALWADTFYGRDVKYDDDKFNNSRSEEFLTGIYGGYQKHKLAPLVETYFLQQSDTKGTTDTQRLTAGARLQANVAQGTVVDLEMPYQFGHAGSLTSSKKEIKAYAFHADVTKSWEAAVWKPKLNVSYDEASGDKDPNDSTNNTFNPLYQTTHEPYGQLDLFRWQNVRNPEIGMTFAPTEKFRFTPQADFFWLQSKSDSWYNSSGTVVRTKLAGDRDCFVGSELSLRLYYDLNKFLKLETGYAHFFPGGYARDTGADDDIDWVYSQAAFKF